jgi:pimeloyl-ACP methyl ester carboxylesterase
MPTFSSQGVEIYYEFEGEGRPIILIHGFASNLSRNWKDIGWFRTLIEAGHKVIALDCRGHGKSEKLYVEADYVELKMPDDVINLMDHLEIGKASVVGYSMGGTVCAGLLANYEDRLEKAVLAGVGSSMLNGGRDGGSAIAEAMLADNVEAIENDVARGFRLFAERSGGDLRALATIMAAGRPVYLSGDFADVEVPVLVVAGERDDMVGSPENLARCFVHGRALIVPRKDHLTTTGDKVFKEAVVAFLDE